VYGAGQLMYAPYESLFDMSQHMLEWELFFPQNSGHQFMSHGVVSWDRQ